MKGSMIGLSLGQSARESAVDSSRIIAPSRRQFVASSLAGLPLFLHAPRRAPVEQRRLRPVLTNNPVWQELVDQTTQLVGELNADPSRPETLRAFGLTLRFHAAYARGENFDAVMQQALQQQIDQKGRSGLIADIQSEREKHRHEHVRAYRALGREYRPIEPTIADYEATLDRLFADGYTPILTRTADFIERVAVKATPQIVPARFVSVEFDACRQGREYLQWHEWARDAICGLIILSPPTFTPACGLAIAEVLAFQVVLYFLCPP